MGHNGDGPVRIVALLVVGQTVWIGRKLSEVSIVVREQHGMSSHCEQWIRMGSDTISNSELASPD